MALVAIIVLAGLGAGFLARGSLRNFERVRIHWWAVALVGLGVQAIPVPERFGTRWAVGLLLASYVLLIAFVWVNRRLPAAPLILIGLLLNAAVIAANQGMPVSGAAIEEAGSTGESMLIGIEGTKHHLMTDDDVLTPLADVIPIPAPDRSHHLDRRRVPVRGGGVLRGPGDGRQLRGEPATESYAADVPGEAPSGSAAAASPFRAPPGISCDCRSEVGNRTVIVAPSPGALSTAKVPPPT